MKHAPPFHIPIPIPIRCSVLVLSRGFPGGGASVPGSVAVHVSIHDVSPFWRDEVEAALEMCDAAGARPALLVVPNFHGRSPLLEDRDFCARLRGLQERGHEVYLHGFFHRAQEAAPRDGSSRLGWWYAQRVVSSGEAEMFGLTPDQALERLADGERVLGEAGLRLDGFVPPAWSMPAWLVPMLARRGYRFTEDRARVYDPVARRSRASVVLNWASRSRVRVSATLAWCRVAKHARRFAPARLAIHPGDMRVPVLKREIRAMLAWSRGDVVARGQDLLA